MKVNTEYGEQEIEEVVRCYNLWKNYIADMNKRRHAINQTEEGKQKNRANAKSYYERNKDAILAKRKEKYVSKKTVKESIVQE